MYFLFFQKKKKIKIVKRFLKSKSRQERNINCFLAGRPKKEKKHMPHNDGHSGRAWAQSYKDLKQIYAHWCTVLGKKGVQKMPWIGSSAFRYLRCKKKACYLFLLIAELRHGVQIQYCDASTGHDGFLGIASVSIHGSSTIAAFDTGAFAISRETNNIWKSMKCSLSREDDDKVHISFTKDTALFEGKKRTRKAVPK